MKAIPHDGEDAPALTVRRGCRQAMPDSATLLVAERLLDGANRHVAFADLNMLVGPGGLERTPAQCASLFAAAGFQLTRTLATASEWVVIEAVAVHIGTAGSAPPQRDQRAPTCGGHTCVTRATSSTPLVSGIH